MDTVATFTSAARAFASLVRALPEPSWEGPGLGDWNLRALVGHASPADYYLQIQGYASSAGAEAITERGRQSGRDLGGHPVAMVDALVDRVLNELAGVDDPLIEVIDFSLPAPVLEEPTVLAARIAVASGQGETVLTALTGRAALPAAFSVV